MTDSELEIYFRDVNELLRTKGWQTLLADLRIDAMNINSVESTKDVNELYFRKGQLNIIGAILNLEETTRVGYEESQQEQESPEEQYSHV